MRRGATLRQTIRHCGSHATKKGGAGGGSGNGKSPSATSRPERLASKSVRIRRSLLANTRPRGVANG
eukprot:492758-Pyramimonas_sp.AAC.1